MNTLPMRWMVLVLCVCGAGAGFGRDKTAARLEKVYHALRESVVELKYVQEFSYGSQTHKMEGSACGLVVGKDGLVMFSGSIVSPPDFGRRGGWEREKPKDYKIVLSDDTELFADYVGMDEDSNMAFVRVRYATDARQLIPVAFSKKKSLTLGDEVVVVGLLPKRYTPNRKFQTARINAEIAKPTHLYGTTVSLIEDLGAPVATLEGDVVGVVGMESDLDLDESSLMSALSGSRSSGLSSMLGGFVIPAHAYAPLLLAPPRDEETRQGWLGVTLQALDKDTADYLEVPGRAGIYITRVMKDSPAARAGIAAEDVLIQLDGQPLEVKKPEDLVVFQRAMRRKSPGEKVTFTVYRDKATLQTTVVLGDAPKKAQDAEKFKSGPLGLTVRELVLTDVLDMNLSDEQKGVVVQIVESGGAAELAEMEPMDVVQQLDGKPVESIAQYKEVYNALAKDKQEEVLLLVLRDGNETKFIRIKPDWSEKD